MSDFFIGRFKMKVVEVAVGVIKQGNQIYISKRADDLHQGGKWEFPGGKREANETIEQALARELSEEIGITVTQQNAFMLIEHDYGDKKVCLDVRLVEAFKGEARHQEGQISQWVNIQELSNFTFPDANKVIIEKLKQTYL
jgi:8-oxo-dGTP diphosphatase